jgi:nucleotide-binding universal stress UspA family protein
VPEPIVVGYDGSDCAKAALAEAIWLAKAAGCRIVVAFGFHIWPGGGEVGDYRRVLEQRGRELTEEALATVRAAGVEGEAAVVEESPSEGLVHLAERLGARMIVVGTRGEGPLTGMILGSTPHKLLHRSSVPVLVVPERGA